MLPRDKKLPIVVSFPLAVKSPITLIIIMPDKPTRNRILEAEPHYFILDAVPMTPSAMVTITAFTTSVFLLVLGI